jgi:hypothetical protein
LERVELTARGVNQENDLAHQNNSSLNPAKAHPIASRRHRLLELAQSIRRSP